MSTDTDHSQSTEQSARKPESPYPRDNYFGETNQEEEPGSVGHSEFSGTAKAEFAAKTLLKDGVGRLDPLVLEQDPNTCPVDCKEFDDHEECEHQDWILHDEETAVELSEPKHHVRESKAQLRTSAGLYARRENPECGHLVSGGAIPDRPTEEFLGIVEDWLQFLQQTNSAVIIRDSQRETLLHRAREMKRSGKLHDVEILRELIEEVQ